MAEDVVGLGVAGHHVVVEPRREEDGPVLGRDPLQDGDRIGEELGAQGIEARIDGAPDCQTASMNYPPSSNGWMTFGR